MMREHMNEQTRLFAAIYANPDDDGPRTVLADLLQERGDPRGEFIALQLARGRGGKKTRRESALFKQHARDWLGPIGMAVPNKGLVFERGFVAKCQLQHHRERIEPYLAHREWATVEEVELGRWAGSMQSLADALPALRVLQVIESGKQLPSHPRLEKASIKFLGAEGHVEHVATQTLPSLKELSISWCYATLPQMKPFWAAPVGKQLRRIYLDVPDTEAWIPFLAKRKLERAGVRNTYVPWVLWFEGDRLTAEYVYSGHQEPQAGAQLARLLGCVPSPEKWNVTITQRHTWSGTSDATRGAIAALRRFASHVVESGEK